MVENFVFVLFGIKIFKYNGDIFILLIDYDIVLIVFFILMFK